MNELQITEYKNIRVLTTQQIAEAYGTDGKTISYNFNHNKDRYSEGKHFICLTGDELRAFREIHDLPTNLNKIYLWTEKGAFLHAKSLNTDVAWEVYDKLVDSYFEKSKAVPMTTDQKIQLLAQGNVELTEKIDKVDKDLQEFKADMPLLALECQRITRAKNQKVVPLMGGKNAPAYKNKSLMHKVFAPEYVNVTYWDAEDGKWETRVFYTGDKKAPVKIWTVNQKRYESVSFNIIER